MDTQQRDGTTEMIKTKKLSYFVVTLLCLSLMTSGTALFAANPAKQLAKGISLYEQNKDTEAMDYFIDVMVSGNKEQVAEANKYVALIHNRLGGIQTPVEVDVNFKEGEVKTLDEVTSDAVLSAQREAEEAAAKAAAVAQEAQAAKEAAEANLAAQRDAAVNAVAAEQQALSERIEADRYAAQERLESERQAALQKAAALDEAMLESSDVAAAAASAGLAPTLTEADEKAIAQESQQEAVAAEASVLPEADRNAVLTTSTAVGPSGFADLTSPEAEEARAIYTEQKLASMTAAAVEKLNEAKGIHLYFRDGRPDALDIDAETLFQGNTFRAEAFPVLNSIYELLALTQDASYTILPPGSYTDDVTLPGIRQAMALNSYLIERGISQGKVHYNMGLTDQEPPAQFANLHGLSIVFDFDAKLPTRMEENQESEKAPLLSMAVVPLCHAIDRSLGEAFAIDFSVLETLNGIDNWVLQIVQHGRDGNYYVVRQLEGFTPVYHQILWNGRKGIIGPELPCGKYTIVLTATDLKGAKKTLRHRVVVKCSEQKNVSCTKGVCGAKAENKTETDENSICPKCNYKTARLWTKPSRTMTPVAPVEEEAAVEVAVEETAPIAADDPLLTDDPLLGADTSIPQPYDAAAPAAAAPADAGAPVDPLAVNNPYDMPYEEYGAN